MKKLFRLLGLCVTVFLAGEQNIFALQVGVFDQLITDATGDTIAVFNSQTGGYSLQGGYAGSHLYTKISGPFRFTARLVVDPSERNTNTILQAGFRDDDFSLYGTWMTMTKASGIVWQKTDGDSNNQLTAPVFAIHEGRYELVRQGNQVSSYYTNVRSGKHIQFDKRSISLTDPLYLGLMVSSGLPGQFGRGFFNEVELTKLSLSCERIIPALAYTPGQSLAVKLQITGASDAFSIMETPPKSWEIGAVSAAGKIDAGTITWNLPSHSGTETLVYEVTPPVGSKGKAMFSGTLGDIDIAGRNAISSTPVPGAQTGMYTGLDYNYLLYVPEDFGKTNKKYPLLMFLHGSGEVGTDLNKVTANGPPKLVINSQNKTKLPKLFEFVIVSPQNTNNWWSSGSLNEILDEVISNYSIDTNRVYLTGLSLGGFGTWNLASDHPERIAAAAPVCGNGLYATSLANIITVPVWAFHGGSDLTVPLAGDQETVDAVRKLGGDVKFTVYPGVGHDSWTQTYNNPELYDWFLQHNKSVSPTDIQQWSLYD